MDWVSRIANAGRTDGLRRMGYLVWQVAHVLMDSLAETPLTGEPDAGNPPVRFGGRGGAKAPSLPLSVRKSWRLRKNPRRARPYPRLPSPLVVRRGVCQVLLCEHACRNRSRRRGPDA